jgi:hypothetical protein
MTNNEQNFARLVVCSGLSMSHPSLTLFSRHSLSHWLARPRWPDAPAAEAWDAADFSRDSTSGASSTYSESGSFFLDCPLSRDIPLMAVFCLEFWIISF